VDSTREIIERRAYELFLARGGEKGYAIQDWLQAEINVFAELDNKKQDKQDQNTPVQKPIEKTAGKQSFTIKTKRIKDEQKKVALRNGFIELK
jgi:hypothetical protein